MSKHFKEYDKLFRPMELDRTRRIYMDDKYWPNGCDTTKWDHIPDQWPQEFVQHCVYHAADFLDWQRFRVSMKGLNTHDKVRMLKTYVKIHIEGKDETTPDSKEWTYKKINKCRIDNYIGALRRGGWLDENYEVAK